MDTSKTHKIGVLLPQSNAYPQIGKSFMNGLRLALENTSCQFFVESIGLGADPKQLMNGFQKLSFQENVALTTGLFGHNGFAEFAEFISNNGELLVSADLGATLPVKSPDGIFQNSLGLQDGLQALVHYFSKNSINKIATSTCYYESGYGFFKALEIALNQHEKASFAGHFITPLHPRENESELMELTFNEIEPDAIVAFHNGVYAKEHAGFLAENGVAKKYPIYNLPFSSEDKLVENHPDLFTSIKSISSWYPELDTTANHTFLANYQAAYSKDVDFFALLGYENGLIIASALNQADQPLKTALETTNIDGPRGNINFKNNFGKAIFPQYIWNQDFTEETGCKRSVLTQLEAPDFETIPDQQNNTGWFNAYLCH